MSFFAELKRRNVVRVALAYCLISWVFLQAADFGLDMIEAPNWVVQALFLLAILGLVVAVIFSWVFEMTPEGIKKESEVDRSQSITPQTGQKLNYVIIGILGLLVVYFATDKMIIQDQQETQVQSVTAEVQQAEGLVTELDELSIAVLPFANRSMEQGDLFFTDGIHDDLLTQLAKIGDLKVISRTSVMEYRDTTKKIPDIAQELGVGMILEGGVQRAGKRIRINAQLIDASTEGHMWAETFDREMTMENIFDIQSEITTQIVNAVRGELTEEEQQTLAARPTTNLDAWEAYVHALAITNEADYAGGKYARAEEFAEQAVVLDPDFAEALALLAETKLHGIWIGYANTKENKKEIQALLKRAEQLAPGNANVLSARGEYLYRVDNDYEGALELHAQALEIEPGNTDIMNSLAATYRRLGRWNDAVDTYHQILTLDPLNGFAATTLAETLSIMQEWEQLEVVLDKWMPRNPESSDLFTYKAQLLLFGQGDPEATWELLQSATNHQKDRSGWLLIETAMILGQGELAIGYAKNDRHFYGGLEILQVDRNLRLGWVYTLLDSPETARFHLQQYIDEKTDHEVEGNVANAFLNMNLAEVHTQLGNNDIALAYVDRARQYLTREKDHLFGSMIDNRAAWVTAYSGKRDEALEQIARHLDQADGFYRWNLQLSPRWDFFRDDPRFNDLVRPEGVESQPFKRKRLGDGT